MDCCFRSYAYGLDLQIPDWFTDCIFRSLTSSLSLAGSQGKGIGKNLNISWTISSGLTKQSSLFRYLIGSFTVSSGSVEQSLFFRSLSGSFAARSGLIEHTSLFRSLTGSLSLAGSQTMGIGVNLTASLTVSSAVAIQSALFRSLISSLSISSGL